MSRNPKQRNAPFLLDMMSTNSVSATQKSDEVRPVGKKKKKLPDEVRPDEVHPGSGKNGWGEGPGWTSGVRPRRGRTPPRIEK